TMPQLTLSVQESMPRDGHALLVGRAWLPADDGPAVIGVRDAELVGLTRAYPTVSHLLNVAKAAEIRSAIRQARTLVRLDVLVANSVEGARDRAKPWLLAPCDLQAVKASGVTFIASLLERVIEERARGNPALADGARREIQAIIGPDLRGIRPDSPEAARVKDVLVAKGMWSQYLEVGIGPDAELFTKCPPMAAVGLGARGGVHPKSGWDNPEPEPGLVVNRAGAVVGGDPRQRRQPSRRGGTQRAPAGTREGQQRVLRDRSIHPRPGRHVPARRRAPDRLRDDGQRPRRVCDQAHHACRRDRPGPRRSRVAAPQPVSPVSGRRD